MPYISVCCSFLNRSKRATLNTVEQHHNLNSSHQIDFASIFRSTRTRPRETHDCMPQPSPSTLLRAPRRQRPPLCSSKDIQFSEGAPFALEFWKNGSTTPSERERLHAIPSFKSGAPPVSAHSHEREKTCSARSCRVVSCEVLSYWALSRHVNACDGNGEEDAQQQSQCSAAPPAMQQQQHLDCCHLEDFMSKREN